MRNDQFNTPVAFVIFNRPDLTEKVFEAIRKAQPAKLLVIADGPRFEAEAEKCRQARSVIQKIDWKCELLTNYAEVNLGCKKRVSTGIDWVFEQVEEAIILEDDCLPHPSFFPYCQKMLDRYRNEEKVMHIAGVNFQNGTKRGSGSYYFSKYPHIWGWATWRRAWKHYDVKGANWPAYKMSEQFKQWSFDKVEEKFWANNVEMVYNGTTDTWDFQWVLAVIQKQGLSIMPNNNMISNIGFRSDATHTRDYNERMARQATSEYLFPDVVPPLEVDEAADRYTFNHIFNPSGNAGANDLSGQIKQNNFINQIKSRIKSLFS